MLAYYYVMFVLFFFQFANQQYQNLLSDGKTVRSNRRRKNQTFRTILKDLLAGLDANFK